MLTERALLFKEISKYGTKYEGWIYREACKMAFVDKIAENQENISLIVKNGGAIM